jgi:hypothetical protein
MVVAEEVKAFFDDMDFGPSSSHSIQQQQQNQKDPLAIDSRRGKTKSFTKVINERRGYTKVL